ncbi:hypothetical protein [Curtobacterium sp. Arg-1]|nr:hypothetical protein [Curtobacterium sp. Arg-1]
MADITAATRRRLDALLRMLTDSGDITPHGVHIIEHTLNEEGITT